MNDEKNPKFQITLISIIATHNNHINEAFFNNLMKKKAFESFQTSKMLSGNLVYKYYPRNPVYNRFYPY